MSSFLANLNEVKHNVNFERKKIYELEHKKKYKITFAKRFKTRYGNSVLIGLDGKISTFLPKKYSELIKPKNIEELIGVDIVVDKIVEAEGRYSVFLSFNKN